MHPFEIVLVNIVGVNVSKPSKLKLMFLSTLEVWQIHVPVHVCISLHEDREVYRIHLDIFDAGPPRLLGQRDGPKRDKTSERTYPKKMNLAPFCIQAKIYRSMYQHGFELYRQVKLIRWVSNNVN